MRCGTPNQSCPWTEQKHMFDGFSLFAADKAYRIRFSTTLSYWKSGPAQVSLTRLIHSSSSAQKASYLKFFLFLFFRWTNRQNNWSVIRANCWCMHTPCSVAS